MKRTVIAVLTVILTALLLLSCASENFTPIYYETYELMSAELPFTVKKVPNEEKVIIYASKDGELGQINYEFHDADGEPVGTLVYRQASLKYAEKLSAELGCLGVSGITGESSLKETIGVYEVSYVLNGNVAAAVWTETDYAYSLVLTFTDENAVATNAEVRDYAISLIATRK